MGKFENKIDFAVIITAKKANPNGDPLNGNRPRENYDGFGEISDVCIKRKIRNRLQDMWLQSGRPAGQEIFVQSDERRTDDFRSLKDRADGYPELKKVSKEKGRKEEYATVACNKWIDVRSFGQVFAFGKGDDDNSISVGIRGPVSIHSAVSLSPIEISSMQITKSVNGETPGDPDKKSPDTMGMKHRVEFGAYITYGSINTQLAQKTGFSQGDSELIKEALRTLFVNDCSSARPDGSMEVYKLYWWEHNSPTGQYSSAKVHRSLRIIPKVDMPKSIDDYSITVGALEGLKPEICDGI
jgi:CRISPR-associated protein Csd2